MHSFMYSLLIEDLSWAMLYFASRFSKKHPMGQGQHGEEMDLFRFTGYNLPLREPGKELKKEN